MLRRILYWVARLGFTSPKWSYTCISGIQPCGASSLLLPCTKFTRLHLGRPRDPPRYASEYESLSPIQFATKRDLSAKFAMLVSNKKTTDGIPRDRSKANTAYTVGGNYLSEIGIARSSFEHQRSAQVLAFLYLCADLRHV